MTIINFTSFLDYNLWTQNPLNSVVYLDQSSVIINVTNAQTTFFTSPAVLYSGSLSFSYSKDPNITSVQLFIGGVDSGVDLSANTNNIGPIQVNAGQQIEFRGSTLAGPGTYCLTITNFQFQFQFPCFNEGSKILCLKDNKEVYIPIEKLKKGDVIKTYTHGYKKIEIIGKKKIVNSKHHKKEDRIYRLSTVYYPELLEDLYLTGYHSVLVDYLNEEEISKTIEIMDYIYVTDDKYRLLTCLDSRAELIEDEKEYTIYHFALENDDYYMNYGVYANGLLVETCSLRFMNELAEMKIL